MNRKTGLGIFAVALVVAGIWYAGLFGNKAPEGRIPAPGTPLVVRISAVVSSTKDGRLSVTGTTNLPDDARLDIRLKNPFTDFEADANATVASGRFAAGPLGAHSGLRPGRYRLSVALFADKSQPPGVRAALGKSGRLMVGALVHRSPLGSRVAEIQKTINIGTQAQIRDAVRKAHDRRRVVEQTVRRLLRRGRAMERYRSAANNSQIRHCGVLMRKYQQRARAVMSQADHLPMSDINLKIAARELTLCVSCQSTADRFCDDVSASLGRFLADRRTRQEKALGDAPR